MGGEGEVFGTSPEGTPVHRFRIAAGDLTAEIITWGAAVQDLRLAGHDAPLVLGFDRFEDYPPHAPYFGATAGRYANRIAGGRFTIDGQRFQVDTDFLGKHMLHGGSVGFGRHVWSVGRRGADFIELTLHSPDGDMGFPGAVDATCTYRIAAPGSLVVEMSATTDRPTLCNLAHHSYFNLDDGGAGSILDHRMMLPAAAYLPVDAELIPTGVVQPVDGTPFDFRIARPIRDEADGVQTTYDHNFCFASQRGPLRQLAWLQGAASGVEMEVWSTEPGVQFYAGHHVARPVPGLGGRTYRACAGLCLEPQIWPDSPNRPYFPQAVLRPGETYRQQTEYRFKQS